MNLTRNFTLAEFLVSQTAARHGIDMSPPQYVIDNLRLLCVTCLQPIRQEAGSSLVITSGYRPPELNRLIGGSATSAHRFGRAADWRLVGWSTSDAVDLVRSLDLVWDQLILEFPESPRSWVHLGIAEDMPRQEMLTATRVDDKTVYLPGIVEV